jgi:hypothetical protein
LESSGLSGGGGRPGVPAERKGRILGRTEVEEGRGGRLADSDSSGEDRPQKKGRGRPAGPISRAMMLRTEGWA